MDGIVSLVRLYGDMQRRSRSPREENSRDFKHYWKAYFEARAGTLSLQNSCSVNGFVDASLVKCIDETIRKIILHRDWQVIVDCGCGDGSVTSPLVNHGIQVIGIDFSKQMCELAKTRQIETVCEDLKVLEDQSIHDLLGIDSASRNAIALLFCESLGCLPQPINTLLRSGNMNPKASIVVSFPNQESILRRIISRLERTKLNYFRLDCIRNQFSLQGRRVNIISAIFSFPFIFSFEIRLNKRSQIGKVLTQLLASNWVVVVEPEG